MSAPTTTATPTTSAGKTRSGMLIEARELRKTYGDGVTQSPYLPV